MHLMSLLTDQHTQVIQMLAILSLFGASVSPDCSSSCRCCRLDVWSRGRRAYCPTNVCRRYTRTHYRYRYRSALWSCVARNSFGVTSRVPSPRAQMSARRRIRDATMQPCRLIVDKFLIADTRSKACQRPIANCTTHQTPAEMNDPQLTVRPAKIYIINWVWNFFFHFWPPVSNTLKFQKWDLRRDVNFIPLASAVHQLMQPWKNNSKSVHPSYSKQWHIFTADNV